jgi:diguanylate cyclase (GGDEF)-like protein
MPPVSSDASASPHRWRGWQVWARSGRYLAFIFGVETVAIVLGLVSIAQSPISIEIVIRLAVLLGLFLFFEEAVRRLERTRILLNDGRAYTDMTSTWAIAAVVTVPSGYAMGIIITMQTYLWFRRQRHTLAMLHQEIFTCATMLLACAAGERALTVVGPHTDSLPNGAATALLLITGLTMYTIVNRSLIFGSVYINSGGRDKINILGTWQDNQLEIATLSLGALTALALIYQPWLVVLSLPPMFALQRGALIDELEEAASTDAKTGLLNALAWQQVAKRELARATRLEKPGAVLLIDLDHFKLVNDTHGHLIGDVVLSAVARALTTELREYDAVGRFGGEEFVAILPDVDIETAMAICERVRRHIANMRLAELDGARQASTIGPNDTLTTSIGLAHYPAHGIELETLLHAADTALYVAKRSGRNKVVLADHGASGDQEYVNALR